MSIGYRECREKFESSNLSRDNVSREIGRTSASGLLGSPVRRNLEAHARSEYEKRCQTSPQIRLHVYVIYVYVYTYIYIYMHRERERERDRIVYYVILCYVILYDILLDDA